MLGLVIRGVEGDTAAYVRRRLEGMAGVGRAVTAADVAAMIEAGEGAGPGVTELDALDLSAEQAARVEARLRHAARILSTQSPLLEGEVVERDTLGFLTEPWGAHPAGTPVLRRRTDRAELVYTFPGNRVSESVDFEVAPLSDELTAGLEAARARGPGPTVDPRLASSFGLGDIAKSLSTGLLGGVAGKIGALIFDAIFPPGVPDYFDEVYAKIRTIVREELRQHDVDLIRTQLDAVLNWQRRVYAPKNPRQATDPEERKRLFEEVEAHIHDLEKPMAVLTNPTWSHLGLSALTLGGGVYLALCQEACLMDPGVDDPAKSSYAETIRLSAPDFVTSAQRGWLRVFGDRIAAVRLKFCQYTDVIHGEFVTARGWCIDDPLGEKRERRWDPYWQISYDPDFLGEDQDEVKEGLREYYEEIEETLGREVGIPVLDDWRKLPDRPLPA